MRVDHFGALPYVWMFGTWAGGWHQNLEVWEPSGRTSDYGLTTMVEGMKMMTNWHRDAFSVFPVGKGWDIIPHEFDFRDNGGLNYDRNGVKVIHWQRSHAKDGASAYRLDWNGLCFVWTGDGRPSELDKKYAKGCDVYVTELQQEVVEINSGVQGVPPFLARYIHHRHPRTLRATWPTRFSPASQGPRHGRKSGGTMGYDIFQIQFFDRRNHAASNLS